MRTLGLGVLTVSLLLPGAARAQDEQTAVRDILDKAVKAIGGADNAAKLNDISFKAIATLPEGGGTTLEFAVLLQGYNRARIEFSTPAAFGGQSGTLVMNGDKVRAKDSKSGKEEDYPKASVNFFQQFVLAHWAAANPAALTGHKDFALAPGGEAKVNDTLAAVLRLTRKGHSDITIYYDKKTGLPLKSESRLKSPKDGDSEMPVEFRFSAFKEVNGVKHFSRVTVFFDEKEVGEIDLSDVKVGEKFDASTFEKP